MKLLNYLTRVYHNNLLVNKHALTYLSKRGITQATIAKFYIGYCSNNIGSIKCQATNKLQAMEELKLSKNNTDFFNNRLVFPVINYRDVVYMTSRALFNTKKKHMHMSGSVPVPYNYNDIKQTPLIIVESPIDCMILSQQGYNAIATLGLFGLHKDVLSEMSNDIYICYDYDPNQTGQNGALRLGELLFKKIRIAKIITLPHNNHKVDINSFYLENTQEFNKYFDHLMETAIPYTKTEHFLTHIKNDVQQFHKRRGSFSVIVKKYHLPVINGRVKIKCPFHPDNDPSLVIFVHNNTCKCFGCGKVPTAYELDQALKTFI